METTFDSSFGPTATRVSSRGAQHVGDAERHATASGVISRRQRLVGRVLTALPALFLVFDGAIKLAGHPAVAEASQQLGLPVELSPGLGVLLLSCLALYLVPRTAVLGAVLLTGYLGGAVLVHLRVGDPWFSHTLFPVYVGALLWSGLFLRDSRVRNLLTH